MTITLHPPKKLAKGADTARWVLNAITLYPSQHNQLGWEEKSEEGCGTTRCVGGWTIYAHRLPVNPWERGHREANSELAGDLLGLDWRDADRLFYYATNEQAALALGYVARGESINWAAIRGDSDIPSDAEYDDDPAAHDALADA